MSRPHRPHTLDIPYAAIADFCRRWQIVRLALFGSALRPQAFRHDSDIDLLATFSPQSRHTLLDLVQMEGELSDLFGRRVDLGEREAVEFDTNPARRESILAAQEVIYDA